MDAGPKAKFNQFISGSGIYKCSEDNSLFDKHQIAQFIDFIEDDEHQSTSTEGIHEKDQIQTALRLKEKIEEQFMVNKMNAQNQDLGDSLTSQKRSKTESSAKLSEFGLIDSQNISGGSKAKADKANESQEKQRNERIQS